MCFKGADGSAAAVQTDRETSAADDSWTGEIGSCLAGLHFELGANQK